MEIATLPKLSTASSESLEASRVIEPLQRRHSVPLMKADCKMIAPRSKLEDEYSNEDIRVEVASTRKSSGTRVNRTAECLPTMKRLPQKCSVPDFYGYHDANRCLVSSDEYFCDKVPQSQRGKDGDEIDSSPLSSESYESYISQLLSGNQENKVEWSNSSAKLADIYQRPSLQNTISNESSNLSTRMNMIRGGPTDAGLQRVNTQLSSWANTLWERGSGSGSKGSTPDPSQDACNFSTSNIMQNLSLNEVSNNTDVDSGSNDNRAPNDITSQPKSQNRPSSDPNTYQRDTLKRRTVSWHGVVQEYEDDYSFPVEESQALEATDALGELNIASSSKSYNQKPRQVSNLNAVHFRDHRDSVELYLERKRWFRCLISSSTQNKSKTRRLEMDMLSGEFQDDNDVLDE
jgi:hypothetical protein